MIVKAILDEDFNDYKKPSLFIAFPVCTLKCDRLNNCKVCQNSTLLKEPDIPVDISKLVKHYLKNNLTEAIVCGGMDPLDSFSDLHRLIFTLRVFYGCNDDVVIYTGYNKEEVQDKIKILQKFPNIIVKFGRYIMNQQPHFDELLGVNLASDNQYAEKIS